MKNMKVLISWSGEAGEKIAQILGNWLKYTLMTIDPGLSPDYAKEGTRGTFKLYASLEEVYTGLMVYTPDSLADSWMLFEAGVIHANSVNSKMVPILFNTGLYNLPDPIKSFDWQVFEREKMLAVLLEINKRRGEQQIDRDTVRHVFDREWVGLEQRVNKVLEEHPMQVEEPNQQDLLREIRQLFTNMERQQKDDPTRAPEQDGETAFIIPPLTIDEMVRQFGIMLNELIQDKQYERIPTLDSLGKPLYFITRKMFREDSRVVNEMRDYMLKLREWVIKK